MEICAVDDRQWDAAWMFSMVNWRVDKLSITGFDDLIEGTNAKLRDSRHGSVSGLHIVDHGFKNKFEVGDDVVKVWLDGLSSVAERGFEKIKTLMSPGGFIVLHHCVVGQDHELIKRVAEFAGIDVYASPDWGTPFAGARADTEPDPNVPFYGKRLPGRIDLLLAFRNSPDWRRFSPDGTVAMNMLPPSVLFAPSGTKTSGAEVRPMGASDNFIF